MLFRDRCAAKPSPSYIYPVHVLAGLKKFLKKNVGEEELAIIDKKLGGIIQEKMGIKCLYRCVSESALGASTEETDISRPGGGVRLSIPVSLAMLF